MTDAVSESTYTGDRPSKLLRVYHMRVSKEAGVRHRNGIKNSINHPIFPPTGGRIAHSVRFASSIRFRRASLQCELLLLSRVGGATMILIGRLLTKTTRSRRLIRLTGRRRDSRAVVVPAGIGRTVIGRQVLP